MDDNYLDNVFREKLELPQHHDFDEAAWLDLEDRLEEQPIRRIIPWRWIAAAGILLPIFLSSFYFYNELRNTETQLAKLETKINRLLKKATPKTSEVKDNAPLAYQDEGITKETTANTKVVATEDSDDYIVSTDRQSIPLLITKGSAKNGVEKIQPVFESILKTNKTKENITIETNQESIDNNNGSVFINNTKEQSAVQRMETNAIAANSIFLESKNSITQAGFPVPKTPTMNYRQWIQKEKVLNVEESLWAETSQYFIPVGFEVGMVTQIGTQIPTQKLFATIAETTPFVNVKGVQGAVHFINGVDLTLGATLANYDYRTTTVGQDFPSVDPNNVSDVFQHILVTEDVVQVPVGLKYNLGEYDDVFAPFVEISGIAKRSVQKHHKFVYLPNKPGEEAYAILPKPQAITEGFTMTTAALSGGIKWNPNVSNKILDNVVMEAEAFVQGDFETENTAWTAGLGVSASYVF